ncbi:MAG: condensation domain-containing protein [Sulfitobacter sp.]
MNFSNRAANSETLFPITSWQGLMIHTALDERTVRSYHQLMTLRLGFRVTSGMNERRLKRGFEKLVARHDSLRLQFVQLGEKWRAKILPEHLLGLLVEDLSTLSKADQDAALLEIANRPMTALSESLFELRLVKCGVAGDVVLIKAHHSIVDAYGLMILIEDLLAFSLNVPVLKKAVSHGEFIGMRQADIEQARMATDTYWRERLIPPPPEPNVGRVSKGLPVASARNNGAHTKLKNVLTSEQSARLQQLSNQQGISAFCFLHAAFSEVICEIAGQDEVLVGSVLGRNDACFSTFLGAEMQDFIVRFKHGHKGLFESAKAVQSDILAASEYLPTDLFYAMESDVAKMVKKIDTHSYRFFVHNKAPVGRSASTPLRQLFSTGLVGKFSMGFVTVEMVDLPVGVGNAEIFVSVTEADGAPNAGLSSNDTAFSQEDLQDIAERMASKLDAVFDG